MWVGYYDICFPAHTSALIHQELSTSAAVTAYTNCNPVWLFGYDARFMIHSLLQPVWSHLQLGALRIAEWTFILGRYTFDSKIFLAL